MNMSKGTIVITISITKQDQDNGLMEGVDKARQNLKLRTRADAIRKALYEFVEKYGGDKT